MPEVPEVLTPLRYFTFASGPIIFLRRRWLWQPDWWYGPRHARKHVLLPYLFRSSCIQKSCLAHVASLLKRKSICTLKSMSFVGMARAIYIYIYIHIYRYIVYKRFLAGKSPNIRSYTVHIQFWPTRAIWWGGHSTHVSMLALLGSCRYSWRFAGFTKRAFSQEVRLLACSYNAISSYS